MFPLLRQADLLRPQQILKIFWMGIWRLLLWLYIVSCFHSSVYLKLLTLSCCRSDSGLIQQPWPYQVGKYVPEMKHSSIKLSPPWTPIFLSIYSLPPEAWPPERPTHLARDNSSRYSLSLSTSESSLRYKLQPEIWMVTWIALNTLWVIALVLPSTGRRETEAWLSDWWSPPQLHLAAIGITEYCLIQ